MNESPCFKLLRRAFTLGLTAILIMACVTELSAETNKEKRERLKAKANTPSEAGKSIFGLKLGGFFTGETSWGTLLGVDPTVDNGISASMFFDARVGRNVYVGTAVDLSNSFFGKTASSFKVYDLSFQTKISASQGAKYSLRPAIAVGVAFKPSSNGAPSVKFLSKKLFFEAWYTAKPRLALLIDIGVTWMNDLETDASASLTNLFGRVGIAFL